MEGFFSGMLSAMHLLLISDAASSCVSKAPKTRVVLLVTMEALNFLRLGFQ
jgi:hypothetical protein